MQWQPIETAPYGIRVLVYIPDYKEVSEAWRSPNTGLWPRDQEFNEDGEPCNVGFPTHWMNLPVPPHQSHKGFVLDSKTSEQIDETLSLIRHNKVYEKLEELDVEAYNMAESLIESLRSKLEAAEKNRDQWRSMWEKEQTENEELQAKLFNYYNAPKYHFTGTGMRPDANGDWVSLGEIGEK